MPGLPTQAELPGGVAARGREIVCDDDDRVAAAGIVGVEGHELVRAPVVEPGGRFIEDDDARGEDEYGHQREPVLLRRAQLLRREHALVREIESGEPGRAEL